MARIVLSRLQLPSARPGTAADSAARIVRPHPPASIDRILTQVPRLTDAVAGARFESDLAFLAGGLSSAVGERFRKDASMSPLSPHPPAADELRLSGTASRPLLHCRPEQP